RPGRRLQEDVVHARLGLAQVGGDLVGDRVVVVVGELVAQLDVSGDQEVVRAEVHGQQRRDGLDGGGAERGRLDRLPYLRPRRPAPPHAPAVLPARPTSRGSRSRRCEPTAKATAIRSTPMAIEAAASKASLPVRSRAIRTAVASTMPMTAAPSSKSTIRGAGPRSSRTYRPSGSRERRAPPRTWRAA